MVLAILGYYLGTTAGFRGWSSGFRGFRVQGLGFRVGILKQRG